MIDRVEHQGELIALIIKRSHEPDGLEFYTEDDSGFQLGAMSWPKGKDITPHIHNEVERTIYRTQETIILQRGSVRLDLYDDHQKFLESRVLEAGDIVFLASGGHGFTMLEDSTMVEVKQGPYCGDADKTRFDANLSARGS